mgnify:CR=1 FL=1
MLFTDTERRFDTLRLSEAAGRAALNSAGIPDVTTATARWFSSSFDRLRRYVGDVFIDELTPQLLFDWHQSLQLTAKPVTANSYLRAVSTVLSRLTRFGYLAANPATAVPYAKEPMRRPKAVTEETYHALRHAADCTRDLAIVDMLWATGCRLSGLRSMSLENVELWEEKDELRLAVMVFEKFGASRYVYARSPQSDSLRVWLGDRPAVGHDFIFVSHSLQSFGMPLSDDGLQGILWRLRQRAAIPRTTPANAHAFRHAFAIRMLDEGHDISAVSAFMGHADPSFTAKVYVIRREDELRRKYFDGR